MKPLTDKDDANTSIAPAPSMAIKAMPTATKRTRDVPISRKLADNSDPTAFRPLFSDRREGWNAARGARNARRQRADTRNDAALMLQAINGPTVLTTVYNWELIQTHWQDLLRVVISIQEGKVLPSMLLRKLTTYSKKNRLYQAFYALGTVERTIFLLKFISDVKRRRDDPSEYQ